MYRVELKVLSLYPMPSQRNIPFLMYRVELKVEVLRGSKENPDLLLMYRVELKATFTIPPSGKSHKRS